MERFLGFRKCQEGVSGEAIANAILERLTAWQLNPQLLRGQAYDGAGAMAGKSKGAAAIIAAHYPRAVYTHCAAHRLNLCVVKSCDLREVSNMMQIADSVSRFFGNSPKRQLALECWIESIYADEKRKKLKAMCRTRWVERHEAFEVFVDLFLPIVTCLENIANSSSAEWSRDSRNDAASYLLALSSFSFCFTLTLTQNLLAYTKGLSIKLQGRYSDVSRAHQEIESVKENLQDIRTKIEVFHNRIYKQAILMAQSVGIEESKPRIAGRQQHRRNIQAESCTDYYRLIIIT